MAGAISNVAVSNASAASAVSRFHSASVTPAAASLAQPASTLKDDTVKLSLAANIKLMHHQGLSPSIIASRLGVSVKQVDTYIPGATPVVSSAATEVPASPSSSTTPVPAPTNAPAATSAE